VWFQPPDFALNFENKSTIIWHQISSAPTNRVCKLHTQEKKALGTAHKVSFSTTPFTSACKYSYNRLLVLYCKRQTDTNLTTIVTVQKQSVFCTGMFAVSQQRPYNQALFFLREE
jgi:hypothetical protein